MEGSHLVVLVHGFLGIPFGLSYLQSKIEEIMGIETFVYISRCNSSLWGTLDGVKSGSERLAQEIRQLVAEHSSFKSISFVGVSLGGIYCRYAIGLLYEEENNSLCGLKPMHYVSMVTPHVGVRGGLSWIMEQIGHLRPFYTTCSTVLLANELLFQMSNPISVFMKALGLFRSRTIYANLEGDNRVPYHSAGLYPFTKAIKVTPISNDYPHIVEEEIETQIKPNSGSFHYPLMSEEYQMITNLRTLSWRRIDCLLRGYFASTLNHVNVFVSNPVTNSIGKDIVDHVIRKVLMKKD